MIEFTKIQKELISKYFHSNFTLNLPQNYESRISQMLIIEEYQEIVKEIICPICTEIPLNPIKCSICGNIVCQECQKKWKKCPFNCQNFKMLNLDRIFKNVINLFKTKCVFHDKGCQKILYFKDYLNHIKNCEFSEFYCKVDNCKFKGNINDCLNHLFSCGLKKIKCKYCQKKCFKFQLKEYEEYCGNLLIKCNLCNEEILNKNLKNHKENICEYSFINCKKCNKNMIRKEFKLHDKIKCLECQVEYWKNLSKKKDDTINNMKEELESIRKELLSERNLSRDYSVKDLKCDFNLNSERHFRNNTEI